MSYYQVLIKKLRRELIDSDTIVTIEPEVYAKIESYVELDRRASMTILTITTMSRTEDRFNLIILAKIVKATNRHIQSKGTDLDAAHMMLTPT